MNLTYRIKQIFIPKLKFAVTSLIATIVDHSLFILLIRWLVESNANLISYSVGMIVNFILQKKFIFILKRRLHVAFVLSMLFSVIGLLLGTGFIILLSKNDFFAHHKYLNKLTVTGIIFVYNFYTKRFAFEKEYNKL